VFRLAVQYAGEGANAGQVYERFGATLLTERRPGEAIGPLRRAVALGAIGALPSLAQAFAARGRLLAALGAAAEARRHGAAGPAVDGPEQAAQHGLGTALSTWQALLQRGPEALASLRN
jgi:hypothetical protein